MSSSWTGEAGGDGGMDVGDTCFWCFGGGSWSFSSSLCHSRSATFFLLQCLPLTMLPLSFRLDVSFCDTSFTLTLASCVVFLESFLIIALLSSLFAPACARIILLRSFMCLSLVGMAASSSSSSSSLSDDESSSSSLDKDSVLSLLDSSSDSDSSDPVILLLAHTFPFFDGFPNQSLLCNFSSCLFLWLFSVSLPGPQLGESTLHVPLNLIPHSAPICCSK